MSKTKIVLKTKIVDGKKRLCITKTVLKDSIMKETSGITDCEIKDALAKAIYALKLTSKGGQIIDQKRVS